VEKATTAASTKSLRKRLVANGQSEEGDRADISKTVENALVLLNVIALIGPATLGELASELNFNRTVTHRLLVTLMRQCFVLKFGNTYVVGPAVIKISESVLPAFRMVINPTLRRVSAQTRETVSCAVRQGDSWVILDQVLDNTHGLHVREELGNRYPLHLGAHGHALMATFDDDELEAYFAKRVVGDQFKDEINSARESGYAISRGELRDGITGVAASSSFQDMSFSIGIIVPSARVADTSPFIAPLLEAVSGISKEIQ
jgi:DNA-binding IclR family transcriptional regulator